MTDLGGYLQAIRDMLLPGFYSLLWEDERGAASMFVSGDAIYIKIGKAYDKLSIEDIEDQSYMRKFKPMVLKLIALHTETTSKDTNTSMKSKE